MGVRRGSISMAHIQPWLMKPVQIDVFFLVPEGWGICTTCEMMMAQADMGESPPQRGLDEYPQEWQADFNRLSSLIFDLADTYQDRVQIRVWDPRSLQGMWKSIRHGVRRYPTFILNEQIKITGWDREKLEQSIMAVEKTEVSDI
jgi:hypothetical protein